MPQTDRLPLPTLLSQVLVAFTIEFDNKFERQMPHRTTYYGATDSSRSGPWLVSLAMWSNCMQFVGDDGVRVGELEHLAGTMTNLHGMQRWGYIAVKPVLGAGGKKPPRSRSMIHATPKGRKAQEIWRPLFGVIEKRWQTRFGEGELEQIRESLADVVGRLELELPDCLPILGYGPVSKLPLPGVRNSALAKMVSVPVFFRRFSPFYCLHSLSSSNMSPIYHWRSARMFCASSMKKGCRSETFPC